LEASGLQWDADGSGSGGVYRNPAIQYQTEGAEWFLYYDDGYWTSGAPVLDPLSPFGGYFELDETTGGLLIIGCPLGPKGSRWRVDLCYSIGPDYGKLDFSWQTTPANVPGETSESVTEPFTGDPWYYADAAAHPQLDAYNAAPNVVFETQVSLMTPTGDDGDMLTADGTPSPVFSSTQDMNGGGDGGVWWWLKVQSNSKNVLSTGFRQRIHLLRIARLIQDGITPL